MDFVCPGDPTVWDGRRFGPCFADLVLGLAGNVIATIAVVWLFLAKRNATRAQNVRRGLLEKLFVFGVPSFGACLSLVGLTMLAKKKIEVKDVEDYELFFMCSHFVAWMSVSLVCVSGTWIEILYNPIMCFCWILKILLEIPHFQYKLTFLKEMTFVMEIISFCTAAIFGLFVIVAAVVGQSGNKRKVKSIEAPLILNDEKTEVEITETAKKDHSVWELLTFKFVNTMMDIGITRQLDFTDLLELPAELRATICYDRLLSSWTAEYQNHRDNSSLLRALSCSYGWTYLRLGLLKVLNDSINFVSPLLLNKFIRFLQQATLSIVRRGSRTHRCGRAAQGTARDGPHGGLISCAEGKPDTRRGGRRHPASSSPVACRPFPVPHPPSPRPTRSSSTRTPSPRLRSALPRRPRQRSPLPRRAGSCSSSTSRCSDGWDEVVGYGELLNACIEVGAARTHAEAEALARAMDDVGVVLLFRDKVYPFDPAAAGGGSGGAEAAAQLPLPAWIRALKQQPAGGGLRASHGGAGAALGVNW